MPVTRFDSGCHVGRTPSSARISATSSPCVRIAAVPQATRPTIRGSAPVSRPLAVEQRVGEPLADLPRQLRGQGARVDAVEVAPGREHVDAPPGRRARGPGRDVAAAQRAHDAGQLVGRAQDPRDDLVAGEAQRALDAGVGQPQDLRAHLRRGARAPVADGERVEQRHVRVLEAVDEVARAGVRAAEALHEAVRRLLHRRAARRHQRRLVESERRADGAAQTRHVARAEPQHGRHEPAQLIALAARGRARAGRP